MNICMRVVWTIVASVTAGPVWADAADASAQAAQCSLCHQGALTLRAENAEALAERMRQLESAGKPHAPLPVSEDAAIRKLAQALIDAAVAPERPLVQP